MREQLEGSAPSATQTEPVDTVTLLLKQQQAAEARQAIAEAEQKTAEARQKQLAAQMPTLPADLPTGSITADEKSGYLAEIVAYDAVRRTAGQLAQRVSAKVPANARLLLVDDLQFAGGDVQLLQVRRQLNAFSKALQQQIDANASLLPAQPVAEVQVKSPVAGAAGSLAVVSAVVGALTSFAGLFKTDYTLAGRAFSLSDTAVRALVAGALTANQVYLPEFFRITSSALLDTLEACAGKRLTLQAQVAQYVLAGERATLQIAELTAAIKAAEAQLKPGADGQQPQEPPALKAKRQRLAEQTARLETLNAAKAYTQTLVSAFDDAVKALNTASEGQRHAPLVAAVLREKLAALEITHLLYVSVVSSGGEMVTLKRPLRAPEVAFLGGGVVTLLLVDLDGRVLAAETDTAVARQPYKLDATDIPAFGS